MGNLGSSPFFFLSFLSLAFETFEASEPSDPSVMVEELVQSEGEIVEEDMKDALSDEWNSE